MVCWCVFVSNNVLADMDDRALGEVNSGCAKLGHACAMPTTVAWLSVAAPRLAGMPMKSGVAENAFYGWKKRLVTAAPQRQETRSRLKHRRKRPRRSPL